MTNDYEDILIHRWEENQDREKAVLPEDPRPVYLDFDETERIGYASNFETTEKGVQADIQLEREVPEKDVAVMPAWLGSFEVDEKVKLAATGLVMEPVNEKRFYSVQGNLAGIEDEISQEALEKYLSSYKRLGLVEDKMINDERAWEITEKGKLWVEGEVPMSAEEMMDAGMEYLVVSPIISLYRNQVPEPEQKISESMMELNENE